MKIGKRIIGGFEEFIFEDILTEGYEDITSVQNFIQYGDFYFKDYKWIRKRFQEIDFNSLTNGEKIFVCQYKGTSEENCKQYLGETFEYWMTDFDLKSQDCRKARFSLAKTILIKNVSVMDRYSILGFMNATQLENNYLKFGIEGIESGDPISGMFDFVGATNDYQDTGIAAMELNMVDEDTKEEMVQKILNALKNGE